MTDQEANGWPGWMLRPLRHYADFRGRSGRREFWWYSLFLFAGYLAIFLLGVAIAAMDATEDFVGLIIAGGWTLFFLVNFVPGLALTTRRLHDMGISGAFLIAIFGAMALLNVLAWLGYMVWMSLPGQATANRWGPPLNAKNIAAVFD